MDRRDDNQLTPLVLPVIQGALLAWLRQTAEGRAAWLGRVFAKTPSPERDWLAAQMDDR